MEDHSPVLKKMWADVWVKVISGVIASVILAVGGGVVAYFIGWWPNIAAIASKIVSLVVASTLVPNWLLVPICLLAAFGAFIPLAALYRHIAGPDWYDYRQDSFFGIVWRWNYKTIRNRVRDLTVNYSIRDLTPFCPRCDTQMERGVASGDNPYHPTKTLFHCLDCDNSVPVNKSPDTVHRKILLQIDRKCRQMGR
jgi:hypothetical protein